MKVLVTGATGFLGGHLCELLVQQGHKVRALTRSTSDTTLLDTLGIECVEANLERGLGLDKAIEGMDAVVHGAAVVKAKSPQVFHEVNCGGTEHLLQAALRKRDALQRFVFVSSLAAHGASRDGSPRPVDAPAHPVTHYGRSKLAAERMVIEAQDALPVTVIRPPAIYGPRDQEMLSFFKMIDSRLIAFLGSPRNTISLIWGPDCARAICLALTVDHPTGRIYCVEDGRIYSQQEFADVVASALGKKGLRFRVAKPVAQILATASEAYGRLTDKAVMFTRDKLNELVQPHWVCDSGSIQQELGWKPEVQLDAGAAMAIDWYRQAGWI